MAQADLNIRTLRNAILGIARFPTGCQRPFEYLASSAGLGIKSSPISEKLVQACKRLMNQRFFNDFNKYFDSEPPFQLEDVLISGSVSEGTSKMNFTKLDNSDMDVMCILKNINVSENDQRKGNLQMRDDSPFVNLYISDESLLKTWTNFMETSSRSSDDGDSLSAMKLKMKLRENYEKLGNFFHEKVEEEAEEADDGPSIPVAIKYPEAPEICLYGLNLTGGEDSYDFVLAIECEGWPMCAQEWVTRPRVWPTQDVVEKIATKIFHIVCKSSADGKFRLSFSNAELLLIKNLGVLQHQVYRAFKSFVNHYKNDWSPNIKKIFSSYHLKTIVLWHCEKTRTEDWSEDTIVSHLLVLIDDLVTALRENNLPMYFMPKYNLLQTNEDGTSVADKIEALRHDISKITEAVNKQEPGSGSSGIENSSIIRKAKNKILEILETGFRSEKDVMVFAQQMLEDSLKETGIMWRNISPDSPIPFDEAAFLEIKEITSDGSFIPTFCQSFNSLLSNQQKFKEINQLVESNNMSERKKGLEMCKHAVADESMWMNVGMLSEEEHQNILDCRQELIEKIPELEKEIREQDQGKECIDNEFVDIPLD